MKKICLRTCGFSRMRPMKKQSDFIFPFSGFTQNAIRLALEEDIGRGDLTTDLLVPASRKGRALIWSREKGIFCGESLVREVYRQLDPSLKVRVFLPEGAPFGRNVKLMALEGRVKTLLRGERVALNLLARLCGIATLTQAFVRRVSGFPVLILDTRKTTPVWREIEKYAVRMGGGKNHRMGLYDAILVKENHRVFGDLKRLGRYRGRFEIEVRNLKELGEALKKEPGVLLFDNFSPDFLRKAVKIARRKHPQVILEASGGVTLENVTHYAAMGVDWISVGALTHSAPSTDLSLLIE